MWAFMAEKGLDLYKTPFAYWISYSLLMIQKRGGKPYNLAQYKAERQEDINALSDKLKSYNKINKGIWVSNMDSR